MARIKRSDVIEPGLLNEAIKEAKELLGVYGGLRKNIKSFGDEAKRSAQSIGDSSRDISKLQKANRQITESRQQLTVVEREEIKLKERLKNSTDTLSKSNAVLNERLLQQRKANKEAAREALGLNNVYTKQSKRLTQLRKEYKNLAIQNKENTKEGKLLLATIVRLDTQLKKIDDSVGQNNRSVGKYENSLRKLRGGVINLSAGFLGITAGVGALTALFTRAFTVTSDYTLSLAKLQAVTSATDEETQKLDESARNLGATTKFTATEVSGLQVAFAKRGFGTGQILRATEATLDLAAATDSDLVLAAEVAGSTLNALGLETAETARVTDVMANSFNNSALEIETFKESMKLVAPIARAANIPLETITALLAKLSDEGISGSLAGTGLRNLLGKLTSPASELSKELGFTVKNSEDLFKAFRQLEKGNVDLAKATELTDERSKAAFLTIVNGVDSVKDLATQFENAGGSAAKTADIIQNSLTGDTAKLTSVFEGLILQGSGLNELFRGLIQGATNFLKVFSSVNRETETLTTINLRNVRTTKESIETNEALVKTYEDLSSKTNLTADEKDRLDDVTNELVLSFGSSVAIINEETGALEINIQAVKDKIQADILLQEQSVQSLIKRKAELEASLRLAEIAADEITEVQKRFQEAGFSADEYFNSIKNGQPSLAGLNQLQSLQAGLIGQSSERQEQFNNLLDTYQSRLGNLSGSIIFQSRNAEELSRIETQLRDLGIDLNEVAESRISSASRLNASTGKSIDQNKTLAGTIKALREEVSSLSKTRDEQTKTTDVKEIENLNEQIRLIQDKIKALRELGQASSVDPLADEDAEIQRDLTQDIINEQERRNSLIDELNEDTLLSAEDRLERLTEIEKDFQENSLDLEIESLKLRIEAARDFGADTIDLERELNDLLLEDKKSQIEAQAELDRQAEEEADAARKKLAESIREGAQIADAIQEEFFRKRIDRIDREIKASQDAQNTLQRIAETGTGEQARLATESLLFEQKVEAERLQEKEKALKRQQQIEFILTGIKTFSAKVEANDPNPVASTLSDVTTLIAAIKGLPGFFKGTDDIGKDAPKVLNTGTDDYLFRGHKGEAVFTADQMGSMGGRTRAEIVDIVKYHDAGLMSPTEVRKVAAPQQVNTPALLNEVRDLKKVMSDIPGKMPKHKIQVDEFLKVVKLISEEGNVVTTSTYKIPGLRR